MEWVTIDIDIDNRQFLFKVGLQNQKKLVKRLVSPTQINENKGKKGK